MLQIAIKHGLTQLARCKHHGSKARKKVLPQTNTKPSLHVLSTLKGLTRGHNGLFVQVTKGPLRRLKKDRLLGELFCFFPRNFDTINPCPKELIGELVLHLLGPKRLRGGSLSPPIVAFLFGVPFNPPQNRCPQKKTHPLPRPQMVVSLSTHPKQAALKERHHFQATPNRVPSKDCIPFPSARASAARGGLGTRSPWTCRPGRRGCGSCRSHSRAAPPGP